MEEIKDSEKNMRIKKILEARLEPKVEILVHGLETKSIALKIEAACIDLLGKSELTNFQSGHHSGKFGRVSAEQICFRYELKYVEITEPAILIRVNQLFQYGMTEDEIYDITRGAWAVGMNREKVKFAFCVYQGIVQEVYEIAGWFESGMTMCKHNPAGIGGRHEFVGRIASNVIRDKYINKYVANYFNNSRSPFVYVNLPSDNINLK